MVTLSARESYRSRITYAFGLLALLGAITTLAVLIRDPALSSSRLAEPVPAPEITVVESERVEPDGLPGTWDYFTPGDQFDQPADEPASRYGGSAHSGEPPHREPETAARASGGDTREELIRSLFWSGVFGLAISLAGLGLVGTRRRMW
ncbi:hypothetical protein SAMN05443287_107213 [Micromonospora phaseoli]|uniref:Uncharacterized protein n=2 Tax=Micromonospora phaseoli TaxID=1144548 RepID=A0A1H7BDZ4_9ACTN|nr:hypothetical protein [Micromonospora phaseoli]PZV95011.1 hypothetical protein CLV64_108149 [Micromonospora phaseoli]GIJ79843.1 hypothetical protein Xph01_42750 [Micromonospora phaseoli]SEJ75909.1 hypothetical protein SAMN05443287_107213 [Micromonospora phaseoli]